MMKFRNATDTYGQTQYMMADGYDPEEQEFKAGDKVKHAQYTDDDGVNFGPTYVIVKIQEPIEQNTSGIRWMSKAWATIQRTDRLDTEMTETANLEDLVIA